ncbi:MAG TPA: hypothetical protein VHX88_14300 [Solirubrobacteraceae bacterium]|jgi:hypothetical protein|nr:hypothetical protein [Solirubrobacteraceae bacterium]
MTEPEDLDALSTEELHDRAVKLAGHRMDVRFLWRLVEYIPEARAIEGELGDSNADIQSATSWFLDLVRGGHRLHESLRPVYLEYLREHG